MRMGKHTSPRWSRKRALTAVIATAAIACTAAFAGSSWLKQSHGDSVVQTTESSNTTTTSSTSSSTSQLAYSDSSRTRTSTSTSTSLTGSFTVVAWNDLGMHCVDGKDYSIMSILPPYNNLHAHVINASTGKQVTSGVKLTYEAMADPSGSVNTVSSTKTNFWQYVTALYGGTPKPDYGLNLSDPATSNRTPGTKPAPMKFNSARGWFEAEGLPITPYDDKLAKNFYPMVKVVARDTSGKQLATTQTVLPVSDEMTCKACHATETVAAARPPLRGWETTESDAEKQWKKNILRLHDDKHKDDPVYTAALATLGNASAGLYNRAIAGTPTLCSSCHGSNALNSPGFTLNVGGTSVKISALTSAMHAKHSSVNYPGSSTTLDASTSRDSCYMCHPGAVTKCLRGAMSETPNLDCQSCHGNMTAVGQKTRIGWLDQPNCQACHYNGKRELTALTPTGALRQVSDARFATNPNTPATGVSLYRFSVGHGKNQCEACHGSTHAEYKAGVTWTGSHDNDMLQSQALQGHPGALQECTVCHKTVPLTANGGPHGMHTIGQTWVKEHHDLIQSVGLSSCQYCHDSRKADGTFQNAYKGTALSTVKVAKTFSVGDGRSVTLAAGTAVGCYNCHNGPKGD
jgi:Outer membrane cytochrome MtrC/MtrF-like, domains II/IV